MGGRPSLAILHKNHYNAIQFSCFWCAQSFSAHNPLKKNIHSAQQQQVNQHTVPHPPSPPLTNTRTLIIFNPPSMLLTHLKVFLRLHRTFKCCAVDNFFVLIALQGFLRRICQSHTGVIAFTITPQSVI